MSVIIQQLEMLRDSLNGKRAALPEIIDSTGYWSNMTEHDALREAAQYIDCAIDQLQKVTPNAS
jgi:hypothetical protein